MSNEQELLRRIERLEKQNRIVKVSGILMLFLLCALFTMAQKSKKPVYKSIDAGSVVVRDEKGAGRIKLLPKGIELYDSDGKFAGAIRENVTILNEVKASQYSVFDTKGRDRVKMSMNGERPSVQMLNEEGKVRTAVGQEAIVLFGKTNDEYNSMMSDRVTIRDAAGSTATLGVSETLNSSGNLSKSSAAAITLFGKDGKVIWKAP